MDKNVLKARMRERFEVAMESALQAVEEAPDGQWIAGSEWQVRDTFQRLEADCYRQIVQGRIEDQPSASQAAFSPSGKSGCGAARQGRTPGSRVDGQR